MKYKSGAKSGAGKGGSNRQVVKMSSSKSGQSGAKKSC